MSAPNNGHLTKIKVLLATDQTVVTDVLQTHLTHSHYLLHTTDIVSGMNDIDTQDMHAVIAIANPESINLFKKLRQNGVQCFLVLIVPEEQLNTLDEQVLSLVDAVLPSNVSYIEAQLSTLLRLHQQNLALKQQVNKLEAEIKKQRHLNDEMEILKNAIVRNVSHELRTPLLQVKSAVSLLGEDVVDKKLITYAENATARLEINVKNITMLGNSLDIRLGPIILRDAVEYARRNLNRVWQHRGEADRIKLALQDHLPPIYADKQGLSTILQLLIDNALKFSDKDVKVTAQQQKGKVYIAVSDDGIGIEENKLKDIFDTFYQIDSSTTRRYGGTGVGLALVKLILDHHDSEIHVESEIGKGSTFWFKLPIVDMNADQLIS